MPNYVVTDSALTSIADAIRAAGGTNSSMSFPIGFINGLSSVKDQFQVFEARMLRRQFYSYTNSDSTTTTVGKGAFYYCIYLSNVSFASCTNIMDQAFAYCEALDTIYFPMCKFIKTEAFRGCTALSTVSFPSCTAISNYAFSNCTKLVSLYLLGSSVATLSNSNAFRSTPIGGYSDVAGQFGSVYVPSSLLTAYQSATNWATISSRIVAYSGT